MRKKNQKQTFKLPTKKSVPVTSLGGYTILIYGAKKIGKTSLCRHFGKVLFLMFEPGAKGLSVYQEPMTSWYKFKKFVTLLEKDTTFDTVVIDTADIAYDMCLRYACQKLCINHPAEEGYGKGWDAVKKELVGEINKLLNSGKGVIFISHQKEEKVERRTGGSYSRLTNSMTGQASGIIEGMVDVWVNYDYDGKKRVLTLLGDDYIDAGHRLNEEPDIRFIHPDGTPVREVPAGTSSKEAYENFMKAFNNELEKPKGGEPRKKKKVRLAIKKKRIR